MNLSDEIELDIYAMGHKGEGIAAKDRFRIFVEGALPEERVIATLQVQKRSYGKAKLKHIQKASHHRVKPACQIYDRCGGCQLMHLDYAEQLVQKRQRVLDALERIGKIDNAWVLPCVPSPAPLAYRNKIQLPCIRFKGKLMFGLYQRGTHDIIPVETCHIHASLGQEVFEKVAGILRRYDIQPYQDKRGELRHLIIRTAIHSGQCLVALVTYGAGFVKFRKAAQAIMDEIDSVVGVVESINRRQDNVVLGDSINTLAGQDFLVEEIDSVKFRLSAASFFQVNVYQTQNLYRKACQLANITPGRRVLDAYSGVGGLGLYMAKQGAVVTGIEVIPEAVEDAKLNAKLNQLENCNFLLGKVEEKIHALEPFQVAVLNPPRKGCDPVVLNALIRRQVPEIIYISCNPATLARDLSILKENAYEVGPVHPYDMFPQTAHVESIVHLRLY